MKVYVCKNLQGEILYIGKTNNIVTRSKSHKQLASRLKDFTKRELVMALFFDELIFEIMRDDMSKKECDKYEKKMIKKHQPIGNEKLK